MALLASETQTKVTSCRTALQAVEEHLQPLLVKDAKEVHRKLAPLENAELKVALAYTAASMYFCNLLTQGIDPTSHPIQQELGRIQKYFKKVRTTKEEVVAQQEAKNRRRVDVEAAKRIVQHYALASESQALRLARPTNGPVGRLPAPRLQGAAASGPAAVSQPRPAAAQQPVDLTEQAEAPAPARQAPAPAPKKGKKRRRGGAGAGWTDVPPMDEEPVAKTSAGVWTDVPPLEEAVAKTSPGGWTDVPPLEESVAGSAMPQTCLAPMKPVVSQQHAVTAAPSTGASCPCSKSMSPVEAQVVAAAEAPQVVPGVEAPEVMTVIEQDHHAQTVETRGDEEQAKAEAPQVEEQPQTQEAQSEAMQVQDVRVQPTVPETKGGATRKRASPKAAPLEIMASRIKRLTQEADEADAAVADKVKLLQELEAEIAAMRTVAEVKRAAAQRASQEYIRKQCEAAISQLESDVPKRPLNVYLMFAQDNRIKGVAASEQNKRITELWANISKEEMQKYKDKFEAENKRYMEWGNSEEGRRNLQERNELIRRCKATNQEELDRAVGASSPSAATTTSPAKRARGVEERADKQCNIETPVKQPRLAPGRVLPAAGPAFDEKVMEDAGKADLLPQLRNLAGRPDVIALGKSPQQLLEALRKNHGMVNAAKHALLSA